MVRLGSILGGAALAAAAIPAARAEEDDHEHLQTIHLTGAGTTNPSKLLWKTMDLFDERTRVDLKMSYRAVGSSTGYKEFVGQASNGYQAYNDFGAGDIPVPQDYFDDLTNAGREMIHIPFVMGAIGIFHSVPDSDFVTEIDLSACLLAKIFTRQITTWDDPEILAENEGLNVPPGQEITVVHRDSGSSSTAGTTEYLATACGAFWDQTTGSTSNWDTETVAVEGSGGMSAYISENPYSIGYLDAGHGHRDGLSEVALQNKDGNYLKTTEADIGAAGAVKAQDPTNPFPPGDASWADVNLYDQSGEDTWPITLMTYFYLQKDMRGMDVDTVALLMALVDYSLSEAGLDV